MSTNKTPVADLLGISIEKIKEMADVNAIIGEPISLPDGTTIIPVSKVSYGLLREVLIFRQSMTKTFSAAVQAQAFR